MLRRYLLPRYAEARSIGLLGKLDALLESQYYSQTELVALQEAKLQKLIKFAYEEVPYYREKFTEQRLIPSDIRHLEDLQKLPVLGKLDIRDVGRLTPQTERPHTFARRTSGSTGPPRKVVVDRDAATMEKAVFYRFLLSTGYEWGDQIVQLWAAPIERSRSHGGRMIENVRGALKRRIWNLRSFDAYRLDPSTVRDVVSLVRDDTPRIVRGYTSCVYAIALEIIKAGIEANVKAVTTTAERLFKYQREVIERAFRRKMYDQYGCGEIHSIAFECERHTGLHVASEHAILELVNDDGDTIGEGSGRVVLTDLDNYAMPLIRYENGDLANWSNVRCACGRSLPLLERIEGRIYDVLDVPGNRRIHGGFFDDIYIALRLGDRYLIDDLRIVQEDICTYRLEFVMDGEFTAGDVRAVKEKYEEYLGDVSVEIAYVREIPPTRWGKRMFVIPRDQQPKH